MSEAPFPAPKVTELSAPYWNALQEGKLVYQRCVACGHAWLPARTECPRCLAAQPQWTEASGGARLISWVVYHHGYHEYFAAKLPYNVAVVELDEGARLISNVKAPQETLAIDMKLRLVVEREAGVALPRFEPARPAAP